MKIKNFVASVAFSVTLFDPFQLQQQQIQQEPRPPQDIHDQFLRLGPKEISGTTDLFAAESWIRSLEVHFGYLNITPQDTSLGFKVYIPSGDQMLTSKIVKNLDLRLCKDVVRADLIVVPMPEFDIILRMDWLSVNGASIDFQQ